MNAGWKTKMKCGSDEKQIQQKPQKTGHKKFKGHTLGKADLTAGTNTLEEHDNNNQS